MESPPAGQSFYSFYVFLSIFILWFAFMFSRLFCLAVFFFFSFFLTSSVKALCSPSRKTRLCDHIIQCIIRQCPLHFFPNMPHFRRINCKFLHKIWAFRCKKVTYILAESWKMLCLRHTRGAIFPCCHGNAMERRNYATWTASKAADPAMKSWWSPQISLICQQKIILVSKNVQL